MDKPMDIIITHVHHQHPLRLVHDTKALYGSTLNGQWQCDNCLVSYDSRHSPFHCSDCVYDLCQVCSRGHKHVRHDTSHDLYISNMRSIYPEYGGEWKCDGCGELKHPDTDPLGYHCYIDRFDLCKDCFVGHKFPIHIHPLKPADARIVYDNAPGLWVCDCCRRSGTELNSQYSWHCDICEFDVCKSCLKRKEVLPQHPQHALRITDSKEIYADFNNGSWNCDICNRMMVPDPSDPKSDKPFHCAIDQFDACHDCVGRVVHRESARGYDVVPPPAFVFRQLQRLHSERDVARPHHHEPPVEEMQDDDESATNMETVPDSERCIVCFSRKKTATIVHGNTGHICCCLTCAYTLQRHNKPCPICRAPIEKVIKQFLS